MRAAIDRDVNLEDVEPALREAARREDRPDAGMRQSIAQLQRRRRAALALRQAPAPRGKNADRQHETQRDIQKRERGPCIVQPEAGDQGPDRIRRRNGHCVIAVVARAVFGTAGRAYHVLQRDAVERRAYAYHGRGEKHHRQRRHQTRQQHAARAAQRAQRQRPARTVAVRDAARRPRQEHGEQRECRGQSAYGQRRRIELQRVEHRQHARGARAGHVEQRQCDSEPDGHAGCFSGIRYADRNKGCSKRRGKLQMRGNLNLRGQQPGGSGTMMRIGFCGYGCATASGAAVAHSTIASTTTPPRAPSSRPNVASGHHGFFRFLRINFSVSSAQTSASVAARW